MQFNFTWCIRKINSTLVKLFSSKLSSSLTIATSGIAKQYPGAHYHHILILLALLMHPVLLDQLLAAFLLVNPLDIIKYQGYLHRNQLPLFVILSFLFHKYIPLTLLIY